MKFGPVVQEKMSFKDISYLELWQPLCSVHWNHLCNIGRRLYEEQPCEIILNLDQWFRRKCRLKVFLIWSAGSPFVQRSVTICAILVFFLFDFLRPINNLSVSFFLSLLVGSYMSITPGSANLEILIK